MADNNKRPEKPCSKCGRRTAAAGYICSKCKGGRGLDTRRRTNTPCLECGAPTRAKSGTCRPCVEDDDANPSPAYLRDGRWVPRGGILRWEAA